jgi:hypothetical protein
LGLDNIGPEIKRDWLERVANLVKLGPIFGNLLNMTYKDYSYNDNNHYIVTGENHGLVRTSLDVKYAEICKRKHSGNGKKERILVDKGENVTLSLHALYPGMLERIETADFWLGSTNPYAIAFGGSFDCSCLKLGDYTSNPEISNRRVNWDWIDVIDSNVGGALSQDWKQVIGESIVWNLEVWSAIEFDVTVSFFDGRE